MKCFYKRDPDLLVVALGAYIGFLGVIWFTWLQVTLFDIRFARDSIFERVCKAAQLSVMVGFASAGTRFTTRIQDENVWAFQSLSFLLAGSRTLLALQYQINSMVIRGKMKDTAKGMNGIVATLVASSIVYLGVSQVLSYRRSCKTMLMLHLVCRCFLLSRSTLDFSPTVGPFGLRYLGLRCGQSWGYLVPRRV